MHSLSVLRGRETEDAGKAFVIASSIPRDFYTSPQAGAASLCGFQEAGARNVPKLRVFATHDLRKYRTLIQTGMTTAILASESTQRESI